MKHIARYAGVITILSLLIVSAKPAFADPLGSYRWRYDSGSETDASFSSEESTVLGRLNRNTTARLRFGAANSGTDGELLEKASTALLPGEIINGGVIDTANGYAYLGVGAFNAVGMIVKVRLGVGDAAPTRIGVITLEPGEITLGNPIIDTVNGYAYFPTNTDPGIIVKVRLGVGDALPTRIGAVTLILGEGYPALGVIDVNSGHAYYSAGGTAVEISLGAGDALPTRIGTITMGVGEDSAYPTAIDTDNGYLYISTLSSIVKFSLGAGDALPTRIGALALPPSDGLAALSAIDIASGYIYISSFGSAIKLIKVSLGAGDALPTRIGAVTLQNSEEFPGFPQLDMVNGYAYVPIRIDPAILVKVAMGTGAAPPTYIDALTLSAGVTSTISIIDAPNGYFYTESAASPNALVKVSIAPKAQFRLEYAPKVTTCADVVSWTQVPTTATTEDFEMSDSTYLTDGEATTHNTGMTAANVSFKAGEAKDTSSQTSLISLGEKQYTELEYSIKATTNATVGSTYCFRLTNAGTATAFSVDNYAEVRVTTGGSPAGGGGTIVTPPSLTLSIPNGGVSYATGQQIGVSWSSANGAFVNYRVSYSSDNGNAWSVLDTTSNPSYTWTIPTVSTTQGLIKVEGLDPSGTVLASDVSDTVFTVAGTHAPEQELGAGQAPAVDSNVSSAYDPAAAKSNTPDINTDMGLTVPATNNQQPTTVPCVSGSLIKTESSPAVYYCGNDGKRYVFVNDKAYFSWYPDFSTVQTINEQTMAEIAIGGNITYRPGSRMVKIQSDPKVYAVARGGILRWVASEAVAVRLYGVSWNTMIDDVPDSFFVNYTVGEVITE